MTATIRASQSGLQQVDSARRKKNWGKQEQAWCDLAPTSQATLKRFWRREAIQQEAFVGICEAVGIVDWQAIADFSSPSGKAARLPFVFDKLTWVERSDLTQTLVPLLQRCRVVALMGMTGIGKTALAERLVAEIEDDKRYCRLNLDEGGIAAEFSSSGAALLRSLGEEPTLADQQDPQNLLAHLLQLLRTQPHRVQIDSMERLLKGDDRQGWSEFCDPLWLNLLQQLLGGNECQSQLILTTQELPGELESVGSRYPQHWSCEPIRGLSEVEQLELFAKRGVVEPNTDYLERIGKLYDGHPLVLRVIAEDIKACGGNVQRYWQQGKFAELEANRPAQLLRRKLQLEVKQRVKDALDRLPVDALQLLCRSAVYRRLVPESFWLAMLPDRSELQQQAALNVLKSRGLAEEDWEPGACLGVDEAIPLRQHNLIRGVAYEMLLTDAVVWEEAEYEAANQWLNNYKATPEAPSLEKVRGYLEAFAHYCELKNWEKASQVTFSTYSEYELHQQLEIWGYHNIQINLYSHLLKNLNTSMASIEFVLLKGLGNAYRLLSKLDEAIEWYTKGLSLAKTVDDKRAEGEILQGLGMTYSHMGTYEQALKLLRNSLDIAQAISYQELEGKVLGSLGIVYYKLKAYDQAVDYNQKYLEIAHLMKDSHSEARALLSLGIIHHLMKKYEQALTFYKRSLYISQILNDLHVEGSVLNNMARTLIKLNHSSEAMPHIIRAVTIFTEIDNSYAKEVALKNLKKINEV